MPSHRRSSAFIALLVVLLFVVMPCCSTGAVVAAEDTTETSYIDYFLGDLFENPSSTNHNKEPKAAPRFRPWRIIDVPDGSVLAFDCVGDVPTLHVVPCTDDCAVDNTDNTPPPMDNTCGAGAQTGTTPMQHMFSRRGKGKAGYSALYWGPPSTGEEEGEGASQLMPVPKFQLKAILKAVAAMMESSWRKGRGDDDAVPESVAFSPDMVVFYFNRGGWVVAMGREDVELRQPWEGQTLNGEIAIKPLNLGTLFSRF